MTGDVIGPVLLTAVDRALINRSEIGQAAALAAVVRQKRPLTVNQQRVAHRILTRNAEELARAGITVPELPHRPVREIVGGGGTADAPVVRTQWVTRKLGKPPVETREMRISVRAPFHLKDRLRAVPGAVPHKGDDGWIWHYPMGPASAANILHALDGSNPRVSERVLEMAAEHQDRDSAREVLDESSPVPVFDTAGLIKPGVVPYGHQFRAIEYGTRLTASQWAVPMGGGKTLAAIALVNRTRARRVIIVCPNTVRGVWPREVRKYTALGWHIVNGRKASPKARAGFVDIGSAAKRLAEAEACLLDCPCGAPVHAAVVNYDVLSRKPWSDWVPAERIDLVIYDEVHRLKAHGGATSKVCARWVAWSMRRIGLTGTPMPQTPLDVFGIFRALDPGIFGTSWTKFRTRYAVTNPHLPEQVVGYQNTKELAAKFFSVTYRPTIDLDLPPVTDVTRECELEPDAAKIYESLDNELWAQVKRAASGSDRTVELGSLVEAITDLDLDSLDLSEDESTITPANVMVKLLRLQQLTGGTVVDDDRRRVRVSWVKQKLFAEVLGEVGCRGDDPEPVIVFCRFRSDLDAVAEVAADHGLSYGEVSGRRKDGLTADSEMADVDVVAVQIQSGGTGVDFTRARVGIWYSLGYSLSDYDQARKRMDRPGQTRPVLFVHLLTSGTADFDVYDALDSRRSVIHGVMSAHDVDAGRLGFTDRHLPEEERADGKRGGGAVDLPFEQLIAAEGTRMGAPTGAWKNGA